MKKNVFLTLIILGLFIVNVFTCSRLLNLKKSNANIAYNQYQHNSKSEELDTYKTIFYSNLANSGLNLSGILVKNSENTKIPIEKIFNNEQKQLLVYRFSKNHCESCVVASMELLQKWTDSIGRKNILILGDYGNNKIFRKTMESYGITHPNIYNTPPFNIPAENMGFPYFFILNKNLDVLNVFVPNKGIPEITNEFLNKMQKSIAQTTQQQK